MYELHKFIVHSGYCYGILIFFSICIITWRFQ